MLLQHTSEELLAARSPAALQTELGDLTPEAKLANIRRLGGMLPGSRVPTRCSLIMILSFP